MGAGECWGKPLKSGQRRYPCKRDTRAEPWEQTRKVFSARDEKPGLKLFPLLNTGSSIMQYPKVDTAAEA